MLAAIPIFLAVRAVVSIGGDIDRNAQTGEFKSFYLGGCIHKTLSNSSDIMIWNMLNDDSVPHLLCFFLIKQQPYIFQEVDQAVFQPRGWWEPQSWNLSPIAPRQRTSFTVTINLHSAGGTAPRWSLGEAITRNDGECHGLEILVWKTWIQNSRWGL